MKSFIFTLDYELYGNGSGNVFKHIIEPTNILLEIAGKYHVKFTFFFEVVEYWKLKEEWSKGNRMGYDQNPIEAMEVQLKKAYQSGHDIQLHLHPQWVDAQWVNGRWIVNLDCWRLGGYHGDGEYSLEGLLEKGKRTIEEIIRPIDKDYCCTTLRAGGYNIQPSEEIVKAMRKVGLKVDTSIYPGGKETDSLSNYDYRSIPIDASQWEVGTKLEGQGNSGIYEFPIVAFPILRILKYLNMERIKSLWQNKQSAKQAFEAKTNGGAKKNKLQKIKYFFEKEYQTWDFCLFSPSLHKRFLSLIASQNKTTFVLVGHPKILASTRGLEYLLRETHDKFEYKRMKDYITSNSHLNDEKSNELQ